MGESMTPQYNILSMSAAYPQNVFVIAGLRITGRHILVLGIAPNKNADDMRESPAAEFMELLPERGAEVA